MRWLFGDDKKVNEENTVKPTQEEADRIRKMQDCLVAGIQAPQFLEGLNEHNIDERINQLFKDIDGIQQTDVESLLANHQFKTMLDDIKNDLKKMNASPEGEHRLYDQSIFVGKLAMGIGLTVGLYWFTGPCAAIAARSITGAVHAACFGTPGFIGNALIVTPLKEHVAMLAYNYAGQAIGLSSFAGDVYGAATGNPLPLVSYLVDRSINSISRVIDVSNTLIYGTTASEEEKKAKLRAEFEKAAKIANQKINYDAIKAALEGKEAGLVKNVRQVAQPKPSPLSEKQSIHPPKTPDSGDPAQYKRGLKAAAPESGPIKKASSPSRGR